MVSIVFKTAAVLAAAALIVTPLMAQQPAPKAKPKPPAKTAMAPANLPSADQLKSALTKAKSENNGGLGNDMWGVIVDRTGVVRAVVYTGQNLGSQWLGSRLIAAAKAYTANAYSLKAMALSTANLFAGGQPWNQLNSIIPSNPVNVTVAYGSDPNAYGTPGDPMIGQTLGGEIAFGGGLALYDQAGNIVGGIGVSGDYSCVDHIIVWKTRHYLNLDFVPKGVSPSGDDNIIFDITVDQGVMKSPSGFGHPVCTPQSTSIAQNLPKTHPVSKSKAAPGK